MSPTIALSDRQRNLLAALCEVERRKHEGEAYTLRDVAEEYDVTLTALFRGTKHPVTERAIFKAAAGRGRKQRLSLSEEMMIADAAVSFQANGTPLDLDCLRDLAQVLVQRINLEQDRAEAMNPQNVATHFTRIESLMDKHDIRDVARIFNLDESGFSIRIMTLGRSKCDDKTETRGNTRKAKLRGTCDHVTIIPVISASGQCLTPLVALPGKEARWRKRSDGKFETPRDFLPNQNYLFMRRIAGVDTDIFYSRFVNFLEETSILRRGGNNQLLLMDWYACHVTYKTLYNLSSNNIVVAILPAHTSHVLQPLDVGVLGPLKEKIKINLRRRTITTTIDTLHDLFTICDLLRDSYRAGMTAVNAIAGFRRSGLWNEEMRWCDPTHICCEDFTSSEINMDSKSSIKSTRSVTTVVNQTVDSRTV